ncbi:hypothetical protein HAX54_038545 [Datura stramonium]|uniref:Pectin acetylesterase n=1 Tax=Datura stramonium TaxID=4076 RepID=A0ABS8VN09_DATST|nr:hypothetical protein [Datura stramonium]
MATAFEITPERELERRCRDGVPQFYCDAKLFYDDDHPEVSNSKPFNNVPCAPPMTNFWLALLAPSALLTSIMAVNEPEVDITILHRATAQGAVCLDGSPPGGGWCDSNSSCYDSSNDKLGSSTKMLLQTPPTYSFGGILHNDSKANPELRLDIVMDPLSPVMLKMLTLAILSGTSARGLSTILNCDKFKTFLPENARVKCVANAGFFINGLIADEKCSGLSSNFEDGGSRLKNKMLNGLKTGCHGDGVARWPPYHIAGHSGADAFLLGVHISSVSLSKLVVMPFATH